MKPVREYKNSFQKKSNIILQVVYKFKFNLCLQSSKIDIDMYLWKRKIYQKKKQTYL